MHMTGGSSCACLRLCSFSIVVGLKHYLKQLSCDFLAISISPLCLTFLDPSCWMATPCKSPISICLKINLNKPSSHSNQSTHQPKPPNQAIRPTSCVYLYIVVGSSCYLAQSSFFTTAKTHGLPPCLHLLATTRNDRPKGGPCSGTTTLPRAADGTALPQTARRGRATPRGEGQRRSAGPAKRRLGCCNVVGRSWWVTNLLAPKKIANPPHLYIGLWVQGFWKSQGRFSSCEPSRREVDHKKASRVPRP